MPDTLAISTREQLSFQRVQERTELAARNILLADPRRQRPYWFDGRFLAAADLRREQSYFLLRQADLARGGGEGVGEGLLVREGLDERTGAEVIVIEPGYGFTDTGELVTVERGVPVNPADVPRMQQLNAAFGLEVIPNTPGLTRTGLFVLALRPVEWTANAIAAYPTSLNGQRQVEDADVVEGCAVILIPWPDHGEELSWSRRRARAAREIFVAERHRGLASGTLPIALVALRGNLVEWVDPFAVRRELGADRREGLDFGFGRRALREAHLLQYEQQLGELLDADASARFAAITQFDALPPAGRLPAATIDARALTQRFFPRGIDVDVSFVPEDEIPALLEESFLLPPIDLTLSAAELVGIGVLVLAPLDRAEFNRRRRALAGKSWNLVFVDPELKAEATPYELLFARTRVDDAREAKLVTRAGEADAAGEAEWVSLLEAAIARGGLWYIRRRHLPTTLNVAGDEVDANAASVVAFQEFLRVVEADPAIRKGLDRLRALAVPEVAALTRRLAGRNLVTRPVLLQGLLVPLGERETLSPAEAVAALAPVLDPALGEGLARVANSELPGRFAAEQLAKSGLVIEADRMLREVAAAQLETLHKEIVEASKTPATLPAQLAKLRKDLIPVP